MADATLDDADFSKGQDASVVRTRGYQKEMLDESLRRNIVIAMDTGSGKTHIAVLRMKLEAERETQKISWFLAPTVALVEQQREVIASAIPVSVGIISGASEPNQWKDANLWRKIIQTHRIMVTTPQVLLDALHHAYIDLGRDIGLLVFDEAHHAVKVHPYNAVMSNFYFDLPPRDPTRGSQGRVRPMILGLTASPVYGGNVDKSFMVLEKNLDSVIRSTRLNQDELAQHVHRPVFQHLLYTIPEYDWDHIPSRNYQALRAVVDSLNIEDDPYVASLRQQLAKLPPGDERVRVDQKLSKTIGKEDTFTHKGLRDFARAAQEICLDLGVWAADWYIVEVIKRAKIAADPYNNVMSNWQEKEKRYLLSIIGRVQAVLPSDNTEDIRLRSSSKVHRLVGGLLSEYAKAESEGETYSGLVFVTRRDTVVALSELLSRFPEVAQRFNIGCLLGSSNSFQRHSFLDITRSIPKDSQSATLRDFKIGDKNLIISTSVAEEGIDIQACGSVIRFDPPVNMVSWAQSRGRARRKKSTFILMFEDGGVHHKLVQQWEDIEARMMALYNDVSRDAASAPEPEDDEDDESEEYVVESTGAVLTLHSATSHLNHFCSVLPSAHHGDFLPVYDLDPPEFPEGWHVTREAVPIYTGPWGAKVTLPRALPKDLRVFSTECVYGSKRSAHRHAAFKAYVALHKAGLLNDNLLPLTSVVEPDRDGEVKRLLEEVEKRASTANVTLQVDPWAAEEDLSTWWISELSVDGLPMLHFLTRSPLSPLSDVDPPPLYLPGPQLVRYHIRPLGVAPSDDSYLSKAREFTFHMLSALYGQRMNPDDTDFSYMFLPAAGRPYDDIWEQRRRWMKERIARDTTVRFENSGRANAELLAKQFSYPEDIALIRPNGSFGKAARFLKWQYDPMSVEEEEIFRDRYDGFPEMQITYPLLVVRPFPRRANFTIPYAAGEGFRDEDTYLVHPQFATVDLVSRDDLQYALLIPSIMRWCSITLTVMSLRKQLLAKNPISEVPLALLTTATTAPVAQEQTNYQRLETLGDTVLKFLASLQLFAQYPLWHEGYLARRKDHAVSNARLAREALGKCLYRWIIRERFVPRKWKPLYRVQEPSTIITNAEHSISSEQDSIPVEAEQEVDTELQKKLKKKKQSQQLSTKVLADVVEALIGASYEHGGFDLAADCAALFGMGLTWKKVPDRISEILARTEPLEEPPTQLYLVERILNYTFKRKELLVEALTHASYHGEHAAMSYERLEFLGDCALDMVVTDYLYHAPGKEYTPGHMHLRKESLVNSHFLAFICLRAFTTTEATSAHWTPKKGTSTTTEHQQIHLHQCLMHSSRRVLEDQHIAFSRFEKSGRKIEEMLLRGTMYPWAALTSLQAPKFLSDMLESLLGAVYLDTEGSLEAVREVMRVLGIIEVMEHIVMADVDVQHPVSRLAIWAAQQVPQHKIKYEIEKKDGNVSCAVVMDGEEIIRITEKYHSRASQEEVRFAAAEQAMHKLIAVEEPEEEDDEWRDIPEYDW
ncbi:hypothetical protein CERSUDRAFT_112373 [Gelatoporia subvermispora B]|uniref:P-loop containing nucleoside triphosphate hydrolase protein n=1 Tax=Ceriporiopsis subvermispora (strain B) TaxID=914234 RepID=M2RMS5_CERS8|nr:hypothetical protein CERSUDRAFT_112373 [Gelatoporia subvermispora B]